MQSNSAKRMKMEPRSYQMEALEQAIKENTILYLDTGAGKTLIAVLLLNSIQERLRSPDEKRIGIFLAPNVSLVIQQARVLSTMCEELKVGVYYGDKGVDTWSLSEWQHELNLHQVFVMTPQVFLDALNTSALSMKTVELLIFDECHHAQKRHPYALIMKIHYHSLPSECRPKVFGMTASPLIGKGISFACSSKLRDLENTLDSKLYTLPEEQRTKLESYAPTPHRVFQYYRKSTCDFSTIQTQLEAVLIKYADYSNISCIDYSFGNGLMHREKVEKSIRALHSTIAFCLSDLGIMAASMAVDVLLKVDRLRPFQCEPSIEQQTQRELEDNHKKCYLQEVSLVFVPFIEGTKSLCETPEKLRLAEKQGIVTSKVELLLQVLMGYRTVEALRCIVFVERVIVSIVLAKMISHFDFLEFIHCDYIAGVHADLCSKPQHEQHQTLDNFADGKASFVLFDLQTLCFAIFLQVNVLIATAVAEEGLDVQSCSSVIRFDLCHTLRSYIQSRGRARRHGSVYTWLIESENSVQEEQVLQMSENEKVMKDEALSRVDTDLERQVPVDNNLEIFRVDSGACRSTEDSVSFIYHYCARLPGDRYFKPKPEFTFHGEYICTVHFPPNAPLDVVEGPQKHSQQLAKKAACLKACEQLYEIGAVRSDTLCPDVEEIEVEDAENQSKVAGMGRGKPKELFPSMKPTAFQGSFPKFNQMRLHLYVISFTSETSEAAYSNFGLVTEGPLQDDMGNFEADLYLSRNRTVRAKLSPYGETDINLDQLTAAKDYQELLLNAAFGRFKVENHHTPTNWNTSYLLLPMNNDKTIDWHGIFSTARARRFIFDGLPIQTDVENNITGEMLNTAGGLYPVSKLKESVVITIHSGRIYCITGILHQLNGSSTFPGKQESTYSDYYNDKYNKQLNFIDQPLLEAKQTHACHNLLSARLQHQQTDGIIEGLDKKSRVELPPEICLVLGLQPSVISSLYLIPSFMFRLTSVMCANQLSVVLAKTAPKLPTLQVLEALTSKKCQENTSYERLELLGDSFLKYAITKRLFLVYNNKHEGQLTARRSHAICNATLCKLGKRHDFPAYICDELFEPSYWTGPGMYIPDSLICQHDLTNPGHTSTEQVTRTCVEGHRLIRLKVIADVVEALVGAYLVNTGPEGALKFMKTVGLEVDIEQHLIDTARNKHFWGGDINEPQLLELEGKLGYRFQNKFLLLEAITHVSYPFSKLCYQRLEFLGDGAIDFLISQYFFNEYPGLPPGVLTDLRSVAVTNGCFARVAVKHGLHHHLRHGCDELHRDIMFFAQNLDLDCLQFGFDGSAAPKILGDMVESIAGAILVDTGFNLQELWKVMVFLFWPLVTPGKILHHPVRELSELCSSKKFDIKWKLPKSSVRGLTTVDVSVKVGDKELVATGKEKNKKAAKKQAAQIMLSAIQGECF